MTYKKSYCFCLVTLNLKLDRNVVPPQKISVSAVLEHFEITMQHAQLKAIHKITKSITQYKKESEMQEKLKRFRQFRPLMIPGKAFEPKKWWKFAITSVLKSIRFKKGAIHAFKIPNEELSNYE